MSAMSASSPTRPQIKAMFRLALGFHHWWALCAEVKYGERVTPDEVADHFSGLTYEQINAICYEADRDQRRYGGIFCSPDAHNTTSGTLQWTVAPSGVATIKARQHGSSGQAGGWWWVATVAPSGATTVVALAGAPTGENHPLWGGGCWENGAYTWRRLHEAVDALGGELPALPPMPPPTRLLPRGSRSMAAIA